MSAVWRFVAPNGGCGRLVGSPVFLTRTCTPALPAIQVDVATPTRLAGWTYDPDAPQVALDIDLYIDGLLASRHAAHGYRADLEPFGNGGQHGHDVPLVLPCGTHRLDVFAVGVNASGVVDDGYPQAPGTPVWLTQPCGTGLLAGAEAETRSERGALSDEGSSPDLPVFGPPASATEEAPLASQQPTVPSIIAVPPAEPEVR